MPGTPSLKLAYDFEPSPFPILATADGGPTNHIDLRVVISNPTSYTVTVQSISIEIPMGEDVSEDLSGDTNLQQLSYDTTIPWTIAIDASSTNTVDVKPSPGGPGTVGAPIVFTLKAIPVNHAAGKVSITITEITTTKAIDATTYSLHKQPNDFPVTSFTANPGTLNDLDKSTTLTWTCTDQVQDALFGLRIVETDATAGPVPRAAGSPGLMSQASPPPPLKDCVSDGDCYSADDGTKGVSTPPIDRTTTYAIDVVRTVSQGHREIDGSMETTVWMAVPWILQNSYVRASPTGRFVSLHWLAGNARRCTVWQDGTAIDIAPADTYLDGYSVVLHGDPRPHTFTVVAHSESGPATASQELPPYSVGSPVTIPVGKFPIEVAFTPDSTLALVGNINDANVSILDVATLSVVATIPVGQWPGSIAVTPDGALALVATQYGDHVTVIDLATRTLAKTIPVGPRVAIAVTPDGKLAAAAGAKVPDVAIIDVASGTVVASVPIGPDPQAMAMTPDGKFAFTVNQNDSTVSVVDVAAGKLETTVKDVGQRLGAITITPDGLWVLVTDLLAGAVSVIDAATFVNRGEQIPVGQLPYRIAVTPDGAYALVPCARSNSVYIVETASFRVLGTIPTEDYPTSIAITPNSAFAIVANQTGNTVSIVDIPGRASTTIRVGGGPVAVAAAPDGSLVLVGNRQDHTLTAI